MSILTSVINKFLKTDHCQHTNESTSIPKVIHIIWVGDQRLIPISNIETWRNLNKEFKIKIWGNKDLINRPWKNAAHMKSLWSKELCGVADLMRYEILYQEGGVYVDADSTCIRPLDEILMENRSFACWESEIVRPGLISNGFLGFSPGSKLLENLIHEIHEDNNVNNLPAWQGTGPVKLTNAFLRLRDTNLTIFPSHFFLPKHFSGLQYTGGGRSYATHEWGTTHHVQLAQGETRPPCPDIIQADY
jgi:mannosyltransferase OCH1-like enzyme